MFFYLGTTYRIEKLQFELNQPPCRCGGTVFLPATQLVWKLTPADARMLRSLAIQPTDAGGIPLQPQRRA